MRLIARRIPGNPGCRRGLIAAVLSRGFDEHRAVQRLGRLCAADRPPTGADIDLAQDFGALPEFRRHFHHDVVLVPRRVNGGHLPLAEGIVQRVIDLTDRKPEPRRRGTVNDQLSFEPVLRLIEIDIRQGRHLSQNGFDFLGPV